MAFRVSGTNRHPTFILQTPPPSQALKLLFPHANTICSLLHHRIYSPNPPKHLDPLTINFLRKLSKSTLHHIEINGACEVLINMDTPPVLRDLTNLATELSNYFPYIEKSHYVENLQSKPSSWPMKTYSQMPIKSAKLVQIEAVTDCIKYIAAQDSLRAIRRVIDIGAGHAHLAASLGIMLEFPTVALDCNPAFIQKAKNLYGTIPNLDIHESLIALSKNSLFQATSNDMLVGLHCCGSLGETVIKTAAAKKVAAVFLVSCCLQKLESAASFRQPLSDVVLQEPKLRNLLTIGRQFLGATNRSRNASLNSKKARVTRYALRKLLADRGLNNKQGDEVQGLSRHIFKHGLLHVSQKYAESRNIELRLGEKEEMERMKNAALDYRKMQALNIPRAIAGELLEMAIILDRACMLEDSFPIVRTMRVWPESISVKNLAIAAWR